MATRYLAPLLLGVCILPPAFGQAIPPGMTQGPSLAGITEYRMANGLKVLLFPDAGKPTVTVNMTYLAGSRHENYGESGMAHLLEHLMFKGSPRHRDLMHQFTVRGMDFNGTTSQDRTNYYQVFQASPDNLKWVLDMEADRMTNAFIAKKDLDAEMTVVRNEYELGENNPYEVLHKRMESVAYDWHSYGRATIGNRSDIEHVDIDRLRAFYRTYYQPDNAVLLVAGKFDPAQTLAWIGKAFGAIPKPKRELPQFWTVEPAQDGERQFAVRRSGDQQIVMVGYKVPSGLHGDAEALAFSSSILSDAPNGRLHKLLVETGKAAHVFAISQAGMAPGMQMFGAVVRSGQEVAPVRDALVSAVEGFASAPPETEEVERARREFANSLDKALSNPQQLGIALSEAIALGDWRLLSRQSEVIASVTGQQIMQAAERYYRRDNRTVGTFLPDDAPQRALIGTAPTAAELLRAYRGEAGKQAGAYFDTSHDNILARTQLTQVGGLKLALLSKKNRGETVTVELQLHWGNENTLFGKQTVATAVNAMLMRGTSKYTRAQLADEMAALKITGTPFNFETTRQHLPAAMRLMAHVLKEPAFSQMEFDQMRQQWLLSLESQRGEPTSMVRRELELHFNQWPKGDPRAVLTLEQQIAEVRVLSLEDLKAFHAAFYGASHGALAVVGDFDKEALLGAVSEELAGWRSNSEYAPVLDRYAAIPAVRKVLAAADKENAMYGARMNVALNLDDPDYLALQAANFMFGGAAKSRLMDRIRERDGLSYWGGSALRAGERDDAGIFTVEAVAAPQNMARLEAAIRQELERALKQGFTRAELESAKAAMLRLRAQQRAEDDALAWEWLRLMQMARGFAWNKAQEAQLNALTLRQVNAAFRKHIDASKLSIVIATDAAQAAPSSQSR
ncbi:M16 family metallopeptidase [Pseudoduganella sp. R-34]|uniref:M16 family metallopeptidase n=1 Tax=Pseudoduganella sp. R-34 TaxID=3404062 RepID=UPI003CFA7A86